MARVQNSDIAERLGVHPVTLSRWRGGSRLPSIKLMHTIESELGWSMSAQMEAYSAGTYAPALRAYMFRAFGTPDRIDPTEEDTVSATEEG